MKYLPLATSGGILPYKNFWNAIYLYHDRPQVINRKVIGTSKSYIYKINFSCSSTKVSELLTHAALLYEVRKLKEINEIVCLNLLQSILEPYDKTVSITQVQLDFMRCSYDGVFISVRRLLPKQSTHFCLEIVLLDKDQNDVVFSVAEDDKHISAPPFPYHLEYATTGHIRILIDNFEDADTPSSEWLVDKLFPKFLKWIETFDEATITDPSLRLVDVEVYSELYKSLKHKYGQKMVKIWPENTDPLKFVYEDVAIAAYLICLWTKLQPGIKPSFVDLGCGNGLLVYILNEEGYPGSGLDVRKRKIWDLYPKNVTLEEKTIIPSEESLCPEADWIIGNHSDELTPWIPVISLRSSHRTNFFLLPCCCYEFSGKKYSRIDTSKSQYAEYLNYIEQVCVECGFQVEKDKLRIPSTKKTCLVSFGRSFPQNKHDKINAQITQFINSRCGNENGTSNTWIQDYQPRNPVEKVRNCTQLDRSLIETIVGNVVQLLLQKEQLLSKSNGSTWNCGSRITLENLVKLLDVNDLKKLKSECGGLQTLLRNHRYIFQVEKGSVKIRIPTTYEENSKFKEKRCWFFNNHPNECLHTKDICSYSHET